MPRGKIGKQLGGAIGGILGAHAAKSAIAKRAFKLGLGNAALVKRAARAGGEKAGSVLPFKSGGLVVVVKAPRKRRARK